MATTGFCCGQPPRRKNILKEEKVPGNPVVNNGTEIIYLGAGSIKLEGKASGLTYYVSDHQRRFKVETGDVADILKISDFILKP